MKRSYCNVPKLSTKDLLHSFPIDWFAEWSTKRSVGAAREDFLIGDGVVFRDLLSTTLEDEVEGFELLLGPELVFVVYVVICIQKNGYDMGLQTKDDVRSSFRWLVCVSCLDFDGVSTSTFGWYLDPGSSEALE